MRTDFTRYLTILFISFQAALTSSCSGRPGEKAVPVVPEALAPIDAASVKLIKLVSPKENTSFRLKDPVRVVLDIADKDKLPDSVLISFDGKAVATLKSAPWEYTIPPLHTIATGRKSLKVTAFRGGRSQKPVTRFMVIYSDITPKRYGYRVIHTYSHDDEAFTQGLVYDKGVLFESTGQKGASSLREVELQTGKVTRQLNLDPTLFGEGITLY